MAEKKDSNEKFYLSNPQLPSPRSEFTWTAKMLKELKKCKKDILYFASSQFYINNLDEGLQKIKLRDYQKRILKTFIDNRFVITNASRQSSKTTLMTIYALWLTCFFETQRVLIVANKEKTAKGILKRIRDAYEGIENYLKPGVEKWGETDVAFANGSSIGIYSTSSDSARGESVNCVAGNSLITIMGKDGILFDVPIECLARGYSLPQKNEMFKTKYLHVN